MDVDDDAVGMAGGGGDEQAFHQPAVFLGSGFESRHGAEIDQAWIDRLASLQLLQQFDRAEADALVLDIDHCAVIGLEGIFRLQIDQLIGADDLKVGASIQHLAIDAFAMHLAADDRDDPAHAMAGFAGGTADAFTLFERFEGKLQQYGNLTRAAIELAKDWRSDRSLRRLEALLCVADVRSSFIISGNGDVIEPEEDLMAIGSGGTYAQAAARALLQNTDLPPLEIVKKSLTIAGDICIYSNQNHVIETL